MDAKTSFFNPDANTPWEMYGLSEERFRVLADKVSQILMDHFFNQKLTRKQMFEQIHELATDDAEMLYVHFSLGGGMTKAAEIKRQDMLRAVLFKDAAKPLSKGGTEHSSGGIILPYKGEA